MKTKTMKKGFFLAVGLLLAGSGGASDESAGSGSGNATEATPAATQLVKNTADKATIRKRAKQPKGPAVAVTSVSFNQPLTYPTDI